MKKEFGRVIRELRKRKGLSQDAIGAALGVKKGNVSRYESGETGVPIEKLPALAGLLDVPVSELFAFVEHGNVAASRDIRGSVPLISWVQAGGWEAVIDNLQPGQGERIPTTYRARPHTYALRVRGDSMEPQFPDGSIIIVEPEEPARPGAFVIVRQNQNAEATFKQLVVDGGRHYLKPLNSRYPIMELASDAVICGVVKRIEMDV